MRAHNLCAAHAVGESPNEHHTYPGQLNGIVPHLPLPLLLACESVVAGDTYYSTPQYPNKSPDDVGSLQEAAMAASKAPHPAGEGGWNGLIIRVYDSSVGM